MESPQACSDRGGAVRAERWSSSAGRSSASLFTPVARARTSTTEIQAALSTGARARRGSAASNPSPKAVVPRLRRGITVCGGESFPSVQEQANDFLHQLLVMDVSKSGALSFHEWCQGVLSQPEVLVCFHLSLGPAEAVRSPATAIRGKMARGGVSDNAVWGGAGAASPSVPAVSGTRAVYTSVAAAENPALAGMRVETKLWWRALWSQIACSCGAAASAT
mmetsp:Transcript_74308/g.204755  ORF Transcript_74308/g.204755 Transcript_74308/m.204755 type:complete len:221 (-) Transcript_74308:36-698(-)